MMCLMASASHTGHGTDSSCKTPRLTTGLGPNFDLTLTVVAETPYQPKAQILPDALGFTVATG